jgi:sarcosine/dimethylglycine N-methyltransferase
LSVVSDRTGFDLSERAAAFMESFLSSPPGPLGLHTFVENFAEKANNFTRGLSCGSLRVIQAVAHATAT